MQTSYRSCTLVEIIGYVHPTLTVLPIPATLYDSLSPKYPSSFTTQVGAIMKSLQLYFTMHHANVQMQSGASDFGLNAIAVATVFYVLDKILHSTLLTRKR